MRLLLTALLFFHHVSLCVAESARIITLHPEIPTDVEEFPTLIRITDADIFANAMAHGEDIAFFDAAKRRLPFEIVSWDPQRSESEIWVKVPRLRGDGATHIDLHYGASDIPQDNGFRGYRVKDVWADYDLVLHGSENTEPISSSSGGSSGNPTAVSYSDLGMVGRSFEFDGANSLVELNGLQHVDQWMTPVEKLGEFPMRRPQGMANDGKHLYFASHNDPKPADILKIEIASGKQVATFPKTGPLHSAGGDYWGNNRTVVFSTGGNTNAAGLMEITLTGKPIRYWDVSRVGYRGGALCAWKRGDRWLLLTSSNSRFVITEIQLRRDGSYIEIDQWTAPVSLGVPQGMDYFDGHIYYYTDGGLNSSNKSPGLITKLRLDPKFDQVQYVDQHAIWIAGHEAEGLTITADGTIYVGAAHRGMGEIFKVGEVVDDRVSTFKDFTVSLWFRQSKSGATKYPTLMSKGSHADNLNAFILHTMNYGSESLQVKFGMTAPAWTGLVSKPVNKDGWHHAVGVYNHQTGFEFYLDGELVGKRPHTLQHTIVDRRVPATIGTDVEYGKRGHFFPGLIDEVRIWNSASRVSRVMASYQNFARYDEMVTIGPERKLSGRGSF